MYQTHASVALLLVFIQYCYGGHGGYGRFWGFIITKDKQITYVIVPNTALNV